ncbi:hypothetical protein K435DRAFT_826523 [Dendrothele bispora CBS 962.96]|uniref:Uncharacterized protein n=1 Tax=Dendrothele bispora (strain CBS 962.96) TaxID=1314807 RepID=A0A4S8LDS4_DENBC|nr:hypothetical protein K435DRAFT_830834 [Dendrothele bispora CBS 962.96]THV05336.1 hypothetical protein K435DRAFT_826523 [Dendrothele bispora CBS 962.96]
MQRLCDEILMLIFYELHDPTPFILLSKRFYNFSQDAYTRAHYFLTRYGPAQAMYHALGRGKVVNERVLDILMSSGAHLSRYLIQVAIHHYFYTQSHFIKTQWVRSVPLPVFSSFLQLASTRYGEIPRGKGLDDGSTFSTFIKESRYPPSLRRVRWETVREMLEKYHFIPFSPKDPLMAQFPLALAIEPRLLPYAVANGFHMDSKYRDFVFRKMFEHNPSATDRTADEIVENVKELCRLDPSMFLSRTVAAEICMEAKLNEIGYAALKQLDKSGLLLFDLASLVEDLLKLFLKTRSITSHSIQQNLLHLFEDFPSTDPTVRLVILLIVFLANDNTHPAVPVRTRLENLNIGPVTRKDLYNVLIHPFMERYNSVLDYMRTEMESSDEGRKGMNQKEIRMVVDEIVARLLELDCKGKMLKRLHDGHQNVHDTIIFNTLDKYQLDLDNLPEADDLEACAAFQARLCHDNTLMPSEMNYFWDGKPFDQLSKLRGDGNGHIEEGQERTPFANEYGDIGQESLTTMIRQDESIPSSRYRRRIYYPYHVFGDLSRSYLPHDVVQVGRWIKNDFGARSSITAVFMTHAVLNDNTSILEHYLLDCASSPVPVTLKHFKLLARLGRSVNCTLFTAISSGAEFFKSEEDYIQTWEISRRKYHKLKTQGRSSFSYPQVSVVIERPHVLSPSSSYPSTSTSGSPLLLSSSLPSSSTIRGTKRPRRSAAQVHSYIIPDSDDEAIADYSDVDVDLEEKEPDEYKRKSDNGHLHKWTKHLGELLREEQAKNRQIKKRLEKKTGQKIYLARSEFVKSLSTNMRILRKLAEVRGNANEPSTDEYTDDGDDEYVHRHSKKRRTMQRQNWTVTSAGVV